jgi:hypothetical protein
MWNGLFLWLLPGFQPRASDYVKTSIELELGFCGVKKQKRNIIIIGNQRACRVLIFKKWAYDASKLFLLGYNLSRERAWKSISNFSVIESTWWYLTASWVLWIPREWEDSKSWEIKIFILILGWKIWQAN